MPRAPVDLTISGDAALPRLRAPRIGDVVAVAYAKFVAPGEIVEISADGSVVIVATSGYDTGRLFTVPAGAWDANPAELYRRGREGDLGRATRIEEAR